MRANLLPYTARRTLARLMAVAVAIVVGGCAKSEPPVAAEQPPAAKSCRVVANLEQHAIALTRQLVASNRGIGAKAPVAVTSLVTMKDLRTVNDSGNLLAELLAAELQRAGWTVVDYKLTGQIDVSAEGDLAMSRDFRRLQSKMAIGYLVTGVMEPGPGGWTTVVRAVSISDRTVMASATALIPYSAYPQVGQGYGGQRVSRGGSGVLERGPERECIALTASAGAELPATTPTNNGG